MLDQVVEAARAGRRRLVERFQKNAAAIDAGVARQHQVLEATAASHTESVRGAFAEADALVARNVAASDARVQTEAASAHAAVERGHEETVAGAHAAFVANQERALASTEARAAEALAAADAAAADEDARIEAAAQAALALGATKSGVGGSTPEAAEAKAKVALDLAQDTADKVRAAKGDGAANLRTSGPATADAIRNQGQDAAAQLAAGEAQVIPQLDEMRQGAAHVVDQVAAGGGQTLATLHDQMSGQLVVAEHDVLGHLDQQSAHAAGQIDEAARDTVAALHQQARQALDAGDAQINRFQIQAARMPLEASSAPQAIGSIVKGYDALGAATDGAFQQAQGGVAQGGGAAAAGVQKTASAASQGARAAATRAGGQAERVTTAVGSQLAKAVTQTNAAGSGAVTQIGSGLADQVSHLDHAFGQGVADYRGGLNTQVASDVAKAQEPVNTLGARTDEAQARAEERAHQSWLRRQAGDLWDMLKDPGFWVGLVVGLIGAIIVIALVVAGVLTGGLAIVLAMALVGAIAAFAGTIVSNVTHGRPWHENLLQNVVIGAIFGAVLTAAALIMGPELATSAMGIGIFSLTAGVLTILTNLATGKPWDQGLLANMLLVGLFAWLGKFIPGARRGEPVPPEPPKPPVPPKPVPPVPPKPVPPEPPKPVPPEPPKPVPPEPPKPVPPEPPKPVPPEPPKPVPPEPPKPEPPEPPKPVPPEPPKPEPPEPPKPEPPEPPKPEPPKPVPPEPPKPVPPEPPKPEPPKPEPKPPGPEPKPPAPRPDSWSKFDPQFDDAFRARLRVFRGDDVIEPSKLRGGEGRLFLSDEHPLQTLKRWFASRIGDLPESVKLLKDADAAVRANPKLNADVDVVGVDEQGSDFILRDFDPDSVPLAGQIGDAAEARARVIAELELQDSNGRLSDVLKDVLKKIRREPPSQNIHWSPTRNKILIIDMQ